MGGTRLTNGAVESYGGEATFGGEVERCIPTDGPNRYKLCYGSSQELGVGPRLHLGH